MSELPIKGTFKAGGGYDAPWLTVDANDPDDLAFKTKALIEHPEAVQNFIELSNIIKAAYNAGPLLPGNAPEAAPNTGYPVPQQTAPQKQGWGSSPAAQQQGAAPQQAPRQGGNHPSAQLHPEGKTCESSETSTVSCQNVLEYKKTQNGKPTWTCPEWRWGGGSPNGHAREWIG